jgi:hypothetical protein
MEICARVCLIGLAYQGSDIVFRFIIEYSNLMDLAAVEPLR